MTNFSLPALPWWSVEQESWENQKQFPSTYLPHPIILGKPHTRRGIGDLTASRQLMDDAPFGELLTQHHPVRNRLDPWTVNTTIQNCGVQLSLSKSSRYQNDTIRLCANQHKLLGRWRIVAQRGKPVPVRMASTAADVIDGGSHTRWEITITCENVLWRGRNRRRGWCLPHNPLEAPGWTLGSQPLPLTLKQRHGIKNCAPSLSKHCRQHRLK